LSPLPNTPAIAAATVYVTGDHSVFALDEKTGQQIWRTDLNPEFQSDTSAPSVSDTSVFVGTFGGLIALSEPTGTFAGKSARRGSSPRPPSRMIWFTLTPKTRTSASLPSTLRPAHSSGTKMHAVKPMSTVTVAKGVVYDVAETSGAVMMFNSDTGEFLAKLPDPKKRPFDILVGAQAAVVNGMVSVSTGDFLGRNRVDAFHLPAGDSAIGN
jgi:outer membrane protein assembly factor BamB